MTTKTCAPELRAEGYRVVEACDGMDLLKQVELALDDPAPGCDVVVVADVMMPNLSGLGALDALRRAQLRLPVLLMTVLADESVGTVARRLGAAGVLRKPLDPVELRRAVFEAWLVDSMERREPPLPRAGEEPHGNAG
jgi:CheY-like chemotaxis protein